MVAEELERQKKRCESIDQRQVALQEERAVGGAMAVRLIQQTGECRAGRPAPRGAGLER